MKGFKMPGKKKGHNPAPHLHRAKTSQIGKSAFPAHDAKAFATPDDMVGAPQAFNTAPAAPDVAGMPPEGPPDAGGGPPPPPDAGAAAGPAPVGE